MVKFLVFVYLFFSSFCLAFSQIENLVPNPSFEEHSCCPCAHSMASCANNWFTYRHSPDYFNNCYNNSSCDTNGLYGFGLPQNSCGFELAKDGDAYMGAAIILGPFGDTKGESFGTKLKNRLENGITYCYSFWVSLADSSEFTGYDANIGFLSDTNSFYFAAESNYRFIKNSNKKLFSEKEWIEISGSFVANGTEKFLIVGNFIPPDTSYIEPTGIESWTNGAYVFFDMIQVYDCDSLRLPEPPNIVTPNGDGINDFWTFSDKFNVVGKIEIFNRWGNLVYSRNNELPVIWDASKVSPGVYFYIIQSKKDPNKQKRGTITVLSEP
jgi:gliding motility-associated-like protein